MAEEPLAYRAFLLRLWLMDNDGCPQWRLSLEATHGETAVHFRNLAEFLAYLLATMESSGPGELPPHRSHQS